MTTTAQSLDQQIRETAAAFKAIYGDLIVDATRATQERYEAECRIAVSRLVAAAPLFGAENGQRALHRYLTWLSWVFWNAVNLVPLAERPDDAPGRLAIAALAYCGGRLVDDGLDVHLDFKSHQSTFLGSLSTRDRPDRLPQGTATSVLAGTLLFSHATSRLRATGEARLAGRLDRLMLESGTGALAEHARAGKLTAPLYWSIVRRKCVAYNMMLYCAVLCDVPAAERRTLVRALAEIDSMAQLLNDLGDRDGDRRSGHLNAFADGVFRDDEAAALLSERRRRTWMRVEAAADARIRGVVAVMLDHLESPRARPAGRPPGMALRLERAVADGLQSLASSQMAHGEFPTYWSAARNLGFMPEYKSSPFVTALVLLCLAALGEGPVDRRKALRFLASRREATGLVRFFQEGIDPDLDDTALVNYVLLSEGFDRWPYRPLARRVAAFERVDGLFPTWIRPSPDAKNDVDPCVTVNVLRFLGALDVPAGDAWNALRRSLLDPPEGTLYYESPAALLFLTITLPNDLRSRVLQSAELDRLACALVDRVTADPGRSPIDLAMTLSVASVAGVNVAGRDALCQALLDGQTASGSWPSWAAFRAFNYWGSPSLTTALALHALVSHRVAGA